MPYCEVAPPLIGDGYALLSFVPTLPRMLKMLSRCVGVDCCAVHVAAAADVPVVGWAGWLPW